MKRISTLSVIALATGLFLQSCGTHMTVAKRQHSRGYYVDISKDKKTQNNQIESVKVEQTEMTVVAPSTKNQENNLPKHIVKNNEKNEVLAVATTNETVVTDNKSVIETPAVEKRKTSFPTLKSVVNKDKSVTNASNYSEKKSIKQLAKNQQLKKMESQRNGDGLSLFWIVILVLIILWALGYIGGLGGFINLLLVVALILLILWLLGII